MDSDSEGSELEGEGPRGRVGFCMWMVGPLMYAWGGYEVTRFGPYYRQTGWIPGNELLCYCTDSQLWGQVSLDTSSMDRGSVYERHFLAGFSGSAHCASSDNQRLFICGGFQDQISRSMCTTNAVYAIHVNDNWLTSSAMFNVSCVFSIEKWRGGRFPTPRDKHSIVYYGNRLLLFGGYCLYPPSYFVPTTEFCGVTLSGNNVFFSEENFRTNDNMSFAWSNELLELDVGSGEWREFDCDGAAPSPRAAHSMLCVGSMAYLFGGRVFNRRTNDLFSLDILQRQWTQLHPSGQLPEPRSWTTFVDAGDGKFFCFGGYPWREAPQSQEPLNNCYMYDSHSNAFSHLQLPERPGLLWHGSCSLPHSAKVFVWGGCSEDIMRTVYERDFNSSVLTFFNVRVPSLAALCADIIVNCARLYPEPLLQLHRPIVDAVLRRRELMEGPTVGC